MDPNASPLASTAAKAALGGLFTRESFAAGDLLIAPLAPPDVLFFVERGTIDVLAPSSAPSSATSPSPSWVRAQRVSGGGVCGELGFILRAPQPFRTVAAAPARAWALRRGDFEAMAMEHPALCILVQTAILKSLALFDAQRLALGSVVHDE